jgi:hypothetical protein
MKSHIRKMKILEKKKKKSDHLELMHVFNFILFIKKKKDLTT